MAVWDALDDEGDGAPRQSYNFAPGYHGVVYRADTPDWGAGPRRERKAARAMDTDDAEDVVDQAPGDDVNVAASGGVKDGEVKYRLQSMKWGLVPFWTKRNPDYASVLKTINCRDDSLSTPGGMWSTMKARKRCIVIAQGFYEWLKTGPKDKLPHYVKRKDGQLMCFAGLWDCVQYEGRNTLAVSLSAQFHSLFPSCQVL
jgi:putative SOS response-associated peptidase YedK